jgi:uncharacterized protein involved in type VI secretion and phage assembly
MLSELLQAVTGGVIDADRRVYGVALAQVVSNNDLTGLGRVQLRLPWLPGHLPWARVAAFAAGSGRGGYFIPQEGEEVLVAFNQGNVTEPYVLGSLWNGRDKPQFKGPLDPVQKRAIHTPAGHEVLLDDGNGSVSIKTATGQKITLSADGIVLAASDNAKITLQTSGTIKIEASVSIELKAPSISANATGKLDLKGSANATLDGGSLCVVKGAMVNIN